MAVLMPEDRISRLRDGSLLLAGVFGVETSGGMLRFIFDRRPANAGEKGWSG